MSVSHPSQLVRRLVHRLSEAYRSSVPKEENTASLACAYESYAVGKKDVRGGNNDVGPRPTCSPLVLTTSGSAIRREEGIGVIAQQRAL